VSRQAAEETAWRFQGALIEKAETSSKREHSCKATVKDQRVRRICDIEEGEPPYGVAVLSRSRSKVGLGRLMRIVDHAVESVRTCKND
jgi:hypothetical protein